MENNRQVQFNWGTFNIPTLAAAAGLGLMLFNAGARQQSQDSMIEAQKSRADMLDLQTAARSAELNKVIEALQLKVSPLDNITYRLTTVEAGIASTNARIDRQSDSLQLLRDGLAKLSTQLEVITSRLPEKKAENDGPPREFTSR